MDLFGLKKKKEDEDEEKNVFVGFVLLGGDEFDLKKLTVDIGKCFGTAAPEAEKDNITVTEHNGCMASFMYVPKPVPNGEAEHYARGNYMWKEALAVTKQHRTQIIVSVMGGESPIERGKVFVKAVLAALGQENALAVYTDGAVYEPKFYREAAKIMEKGELPILNLVWFGVYSDEKRRGIYTCGMKSLGKDEMEIYAESSDDIDLNKIRIFAADIVYYVLDGDVTLRDGETIGLTAEQKLPITKSKGIALDGQTLKIKYSV